MSTIISITCACCADTEFANKQSIRLKECLHTLCCLCYAKVSAERGCRPYLACPVPGCGRNSISFTFVQNKKKDAIEGEFNQYSQQSSAAESSLSTRRDESSTQQLSQLTTSSIDEDQRITQKKRRLSNDSDGMDNTEQEEIDIDDDSDGMDDTETEPKEIDILSPDAAEAAALFLIRSSAFSAIRCDPYTFILNSQYTTQSSPVFTAVPNGIPVNPSHLASVFHKSTTIESSS